MNIPEAITKIRQTAVGAVALSEWLGDGGHPVEPRVAAVRSKRCKRCPKNATTGWGLTKVVADKIKEHTAYKHKLELSTEDDLKLGTCIACGCHLKLKVWVPLPYILKHQTKEVESRLWEECWIKNEQKPVEKPKEPVAA